MIVIEERERRSCISLSRRSRDRSTSLRVEFQQISFQINELVVKASINCIVFQPTIGEKTSNKITEHSCESLLRRSSRQLCSNKSMSMHKSSCKEKLLQHTVNQMCQDPYHLHRGLLTEWMMIRQLPSLIKPRIWEIEKEKRSYSFQLSMLSGVHWWHKILCSQEPNHMIIGVLEIQIILKRLEPQSMIQEATSKNRERVLSVGATFNGDKM